MYFVVVRVTGQLVAPNRFPLAAGVTVLPRVSEAPEIFALFEELGSVVSVPVLPNVFHVNIGAATRVTVKLWVTSVAAL